MNLVRDAPGVVFAFRHRSVEAIVGHDFGAIVAPWCALSRPDVFRAVAIMSRGSRARRRFHSTP